MSQRKSGIIIQYINIALDFFIAIFFTPFLIKALGDAEYGLYRVVQSFAGQLSILSFGISTLVARNIVKFDTLREKKEKENFLATAAIATLLLSILVLVVGAIMSIGVKTLFDKNFSDEEILLAQKLYWFLIFNIAVTVITDMASGLLIGHEKFFVKNGLTTLRQFLRVSILTVLLKINLGSIAIVFTDLVLSVIIMALEFVYGFGILHERARFYYLDKKELKVSITFSFAIFLQAIVNQVNQNLDSVILGALTTTSVVTMYSIALSLFTMFNSITMVFGTVFVPQATRMIINGASSEELTKLVVRPGRFAVMIGTLIITGFIIVGKDFISFWVGEKYLGAYLVTIILMIPGMLPLMQNVTNAVLDAMMKRMGRSLILVAMAVINIFVSVILVKKIGYIGAAFGTAFSYVVGYLVFNNIYIYRVTGINIKKMYKGLLKKILLTAIICFILGYTLTLVPSANVVYLMIKIAIYTFMYSFAMYRYGMHTYEREIVKGIVKRVINKGKRND